MQLAVNPCRALKVRRMILKLILCWIGSQWSFLGLVRRLKSSHNNILFYQFLPKPIESSRGQFIIALVRKPFYFTENATLVIAVDKNGPK